MYDLFYRSFMRKRDRPNSSVREPVQVYLAPDDRDLLARLVEETGLSKAEILRRGVRSFAREQRVTSPMLRFVAESGGEGWPNDIAKRHDDVLAASYRSEPKRKRR
jgi:hypothetical protein